MGLILFCVAALFFFFAGVGVTIIPNPVSWGFCALAIGLAVGGWIPWKKSSP